MHETTEILASEQQEINDLDSLHDGGIPTDPGIMTEVNVDIDIFYMDIF